MARLETAAPMEQFVAPDKAKLIKAVHEVMDGKG